MSDEAILLDVPMYGRRAIRAAKEKDSSRAMNNAKRGCILHQCDG